MPDNVSIMHRAEELFEEAEMSQEESDSVVSNGFVAVSVSELGCWCAKSDTLL